MTVIREAHVTEHDGGCGLMLRPWTEVADPPDDTSHADGGLDAVVPAAPFWASPPAGASATADTGTVPSAGPLPETHGPGAFLEAASRFASGVTIVTSRDQDGNPCGFTASAFSSLSASPPMVLVCIDQTARCHSAFMDAGLFAVSILRPRHRRVALRFASKEADKFSGEQFRDDENDLPLLPDALASFVCGTEQRIPAGDHTILIGRVISVRLGEGEPAVFFRRRFRRVR